MRKKAKIAIELIDRSNARGYRPGIVLVDAGYGNNSSFLSELEQRKLKYLGGIAKNRKVKVVNSEGEQVERRLDEIARTLTSQELVKVQVNNVTKQVWVSRFTARINSLGNSQTFAIVMNANSFELATDIDYFITNVETSSVTPEWVVATYTQRNWVEVF